MPIIRPIHGNQAGQEIDVPLHVAEIELQFGTAELVSMEDEPPQANLQGWRKNSLSLGEFENATESVNPEEEEEEEAIARATEPATKTSEGQLI